MIFQTIGRKDYFNQSDIYIKSSFLYCVISIMLPFILFFSNFPPTRRKKGGRGDEKVRGDQIRKKGLAKVEERGAF